ncbi:MAG: hypothetical protein NVSMB46_03650 [Candidatus Saccharimonadales bacterium]
MKTTVVPAQITTVEDKIAGNLSFTQLLLLTTPIFIDGFLYVVFPPFTRLSVGKIIICGIAAILCLILAVRIKGTLILSWVVVLISYYMRPTYYLFNKNSDYLRSNEHSETLTDISYTEETVNAIEPLNSIPLSISQMIQLESVMADPQTKFHLMTHKGGLYVHISEVKEQ